MKTFILFSPIFKLFISRLTKSWIHHIIFNLRMSRFLIKIILQGILLHQKST